MATNLALQLQVIEPDTDLNSIMIGYSRYSDDVWDLRAFITAKTFPQKLTVTSETISEIINSPLTAIDNSPLLKDNQDILDIIVEYEPATLAVEISRLLSRIEDVFMTKVEEDKRLTTQVRNLSTRIGTIRPATEDEDKDSEQVVDLNQLAREALNNASRNNPKKRSKK